jgi:hypothetical protein
LTLALYGKSRRRQGALLGAALLAIIVATIGGLSIMTSAFAHHNEYCTSGTCDGWRATANYKGGNSKTLVIMDNVKIGGQDYQPSWSSGYATGDGTSNGIKQYSSAGQIDGKSLPTGDGAVTPGDNVYYWYGVDDAWDIFTRSGPWSAGAFSGRILLYYESGNTWSYSHGDSITPQDNDRGTITAPTRPSNCNRTIRVFKVVEGSGAPSNATFAYQIRQGTPPTFIHYDSVPNSSGDAYDDVRVSKNVAYTLVETERLSGPWSFGEYKIKQGTQQNCNGNDWTSAGNNQSAGVSIPNDNNNYTICIYNRYDGNFPKTCQDLGLVLIDKFEWNNNAYNWVNDGTQQVTITSGTATGGNWTSTVPIGAVIVKASTDFKVIPSSPPYWVNTFSGSFDNSGMTNPGGQTPNISNVQFCGGTYQTVEPGLSKVANTPGYNNGYARWIIKVDNTANNFPVQVTLNDAGVKNDGTITVGGTCTDGDISDGSVTCTVNAGATLQIPVKKAVARQCQEGSAGNSVSGTWVNPANQQQGGTFTKTDGPSITIPADESLCDQPGIVKTANTSQTTDPDAVSWTVTVTNPATGSNGPGTTRTVWIKDQNVTVTSGPTYTNGASCTPSTTFEADLNGAGVKCSMPNNSSITFTVKPNPAPASTCQDQVFTNTAELYVDSKDSTPITAPGGQITLQGNPDLCNKTLKICKVVVGNGDGIVTSGQFNFDVRNATSNQNIHNGLPGGAISASEPNPDNTDGTNGTQACQDVSVPATAQVQVVERPRPTGWTDASGYPKYSINGGSQVSNGTTSIIDMAQATSPVTVTFYNKEVPTVVASDKRILVKKVVRGQAGDTTFFTANLTGPGIDGTATELFSQQTPGLFLGLTAGTFTVNETPKAGYAYAGWALGTITGETTVTCPPNPTSDGKDASVTLTNVNPQAAICFYNDPKVTVRVHKTLNVIGFTSHGAGWQFTISGCGITPQTKTTDANGIAGFTDLPPAIGCSYEVTETVQPGWTPQFVTQYAQPTKGGEVATLDFLNIRVFNPPCVDPNDARCTPPPPPSTPTPTATPATPGQPTNTPTATPTNTPTPTPTNTPVTTIAGERTPGPGQSPTPLAPATGYGFGASQGGMNLMLVVAGLIGLSLGLGFLALRRRRSDR